MDLFIPGPVGRLEAVLWQPADKQAPRAAAVMCHPHPLFGGTMKTNALFRAARGLQNAGLAVLRFNFRGVEKSEGAHDGQGGEELDALAALDWIERELPGVPLWGGGYSFGARTMAALALRDGRIKRVVLVALPFRIYDCPPIDRLEQPGLILFGGNDEFGTRADLQARHPSLPPRLEVLEIAGADHHFRGKTPQVEDAIKKHARAALGADVGTAGRR